MTSRHSRARHSTDNSSAQPLGMTEFASEVTASWDRAMASGLACYESWLKVVSTPLSAALGVDPSRPFAAGANGERRASVLPWMPKLETQVIPFRRATDPPGAEGSRITMRMAMPAIFGASAVSIDTLVPLPATEAGGGEVTPAHV